MSLWRCIVVCLFLTACAGAGTPGVGGTNPGGSNPTPGGGGTPTAPPGNVASIGGCQVFPSDNPWNEDISGLPVDPNSATYLAQMNASTTNLHPDFGSNPTYGIPYVTVHGKTQPFVPINFTLYGSEKIRAPIPFLPTHRSKAARDQPATATSSSSTSTTASTTR